MKQKTPIKPPTPPPTGKKTIYALVKLEVDKASLSIDVFKLLPGANPEMPGDEIPVNFGKLFVTLPYGQLAFSENARFPIMNTEMFVKGLKVVSELKAMIEK
jgi:hypothetical protein